MKSILDPTFRYTPSVETDLRRTFARIRREQRARDVTRDVKASRDAQNRCAVVPLARPPRLADSAR
jgi:hypothetical protein